MGRAYARSGIFFAPEDRCSLRKAVYSMNEVIRNLKAQDAQADRYDTDLMKEPFRD
jgi:hypothetical protein